MIERIVHFFSNEPCIALVGNPNCGKTALFNQLTGSRQKVGNYAGVTVERKSGKLVLASGKTVHLIDLPGTYSLVPSSPDEQVTCDVLSGRAKGEKRPDLVVCVVDATNLRRTLRLLLAVNRTGLPCIVALNMTDLAAQYEQPVDPQQLSALLGVPVVSTVGSKVGGADNLKNKLNETALRRPQPIICDDPSQDQSRVRQIVQSLGLETANPHALSDRIDNLVLHPVYGLVLLSLVLFFMFQAVFVLAETPMKGIQSGTAWISDCVTALVPEGWLRSLLVSGVIAGLGGVLVFLPQIIVLFFFILVLEESGYLPRAAFLLDRLMGSVGLSGRSFIPLLSSFACAVPGIMAARSIGNTRDRLATIMIAPLMTCSARLPVYTLLIGAFVPQKDLALGVSLQGLVLFALYLAGIVSAMGVALVITRLVNRRRLSRPLLMELPLYHWPSARHVLFGLWHRAWIFLKRVGGVILAMTIGLWFLASFPAGNKIENSYAGLLGKSLSTVFAPLGFNWQIGVALVPGMAAREVVVSSLATVYAIGASKDDAAQSLAPIIKTQWSIATALSLLAWFVFAPQCLSTLAVVKRETGGWLMPSVMLMYLFSLAYVAAFLTFSIATAAGLG
jgi:ferrous iron transport protein B